MSGGGVVRRRSRGRYLKKNAKTERVAVVGSVMCDRIKSHVGRSTKDQNRNSDGTLGDYREAMCSTEALESHTRNERRTLEGLAGLAELGATGTPDPMATKFCTADETPGVGGRYCREYGGVETNWRV